MRGYRPVVYTPPYYPPVSFKFSFLAEGFIQCAQKRGGNKHKSKVIEFTYGFNHRLISRIVRVLLLQTRLSKEGGSKIIEKWCLKDESDSFFVGLNALMAHAHESKKVQSACSIVILNNTGRWHDSNRVSASTSNQWIVQILTPYTSIIKHFIYRN